MPLRPRPMRFTEAKTDVEKKVLEEKQSERRNYWVSKLRAAATVEVSQKGVARFLKENAIP